MRSCGSGGLHDRPAPCDGGRPRGRDPGLAVGRARLAGGRRNAGVHRHAAGRGIGGPARLRLPGRALDGAPSPAQAGHARVARVRRYVPEPPAAGRGGQPGGARAGVARRRLSRRRPPRVRREDAGVGDLVAGRPLSARHLRPAGEGPLRERGGHVRLRLPAGRQADARPLRVVADHADVRPLGAGHVGRLRPDVGRQLDHGVPSRARSSGGLGAGRERAGRPRLRFPARRLAGASPLPPRRDARVGRGRRGRARTVP